MRLRYTADYPERQEIIMGAQGGGRYHFPYDQMDPRPTESDPIYKIYVDPEVASEGVTYLLASGAEGTVLLDHVFSLRAERQRRDKPSRPRRRDGGSGRYHP